MDLTTERIHEIFLEVESSFPFKGYINEFKFNKYHQIIKKIIKEYPPGSKILSIGAGPCSLEAILSKLNYSVTAVDDLSDQWHLIGNNRQRIKNFAKEFNIKLIVQSAEIYQLEENYFDVVLLIDIVEHLHETPRELLNTAITFLKINGLIIIEVPNTASLKNRIIVLFGKSNQVNIKFIFWNIGKYRSHFREYTKSELLYIMSICKLKSINVKMLNLRTDMIYRSTKSILKKTPILIYKIISCIYPNFRDTIIASGKKPYDWAPIQISIKNFKKCYGLIGLYNLDNVTDEILINQITTAEF